MPRDLTRGGTWPSTRGLTILKYCDSTPTPGLSFTLAREMDLLMAGTFALMKYHQWVCTAAVCCLRLTSPLSGHVGAGAEGSLIHISSSLSGPWTPLINSTLDCYNPSAWQHSNGTLYFLCLINSGEFQLKSGLDIFSDFNLITTININKLVGLEKVMWA